MACEAARFAGECSGAGTRHAPGCPLIRRPYAPSLNSVTGRGSLITAIDRSFTSTTSISAPPISATINRLDHYRNLQRNHRLRRSAGKASAATLDSNGRPAGASLVLNITNLRALSLALSDEMEWVGEPSAVWGTFHGEQAGTRVMP